MKPYVVRQGDYLTKLAFVLGFDADAVWSDPKNAELTSARDRNLLHPGDVLWLPDRARRPLPIAAGAANKYVATITRTNIRLRFKGDKEPLANEPYVVEGLGAP